MYDNVPDRFIPEGGKPDLVYPLPYLDYIHNNEDLNLSYEFLDRGIEENGWGDTIAIRSLSTEEVITYAELRSRIETLAGGLRNLGVEPGDRVLWRFGEVPEAIVTQLAIWKVGGVNVPSALTENTRELRFYLNDTEASVMVTSDELFDAVADALSDATHLEEVIVHGEKTHGYRSFDGLLDSATPYTEYASTDPFDVSSIFYTGGTTGRPKGCIHSHAAETAISDIEGTDGRALTSDDVLYCPAPIGHAMGNNVKITYPLRYGAEVILARRPSPVEMLEIIDDYGVTIFEGLGTMIRMMLNDADLSVYDLSALRMLVTPIIDEELYAEWTAATGVEMFNPMGMSPMRSYFVVPYRQGDKTAPDVSLGKPHSGFEAKVVDVDDPHTEVDRGEIGTLLIRGPTGISYWNNIHPDMPGRIERDLVKGWSRLDDAYYQTDDGYLYHVGRLDDMIESAGRQISPLEVEEVVGGHPAVAEIAVVGKPEEVREEIVKAYIVPRDPVTADESLKEQLQTYAKDNMALYKYPREIEFVDSLPMDAQGKIQRKELRDRARDES